ncbi:MAG: Fe-S protein [Acidobacteriota bacterium]
MRLFSRRKRPMHLGPYPMERLKRWPERTHAHLSWPWPGGRIGASREPVERHSPHAIALAMTPTARLYDALRDGTAARKKAPIPDDATIRANNLKASCYFLDATFVGTCEIPDGAWHRGAGRCEGGPLHDHRYGVVILVEYAKEVMAGSPGATWLKDGQAAQAALRAAEIAVATAGYIRQLGYPARAHTATASDLDIGRLVLHAGLGESGAAGRAPTGRATAAPTAGWPQLTNPYIGARFSAAAVSTALEIAADRPLARRNLVDRWRAKGPRYWLGIGGTLPGWKRLAAARRPLHLGAYPMERIKRVESSTTLVTDAVPRVPKRASFFARARFGDLGEIARREVRRFAWKTPSVQAMTPLIRGMVPLQDGEVAAAEAPGTSDPTANANAIKAASYFLGSEITGICRIPEFAWFSHQLDGRPIEPAHENAVVMLIDQGYETTEGASGDDWMSGVQSMRAYLHGQEIAGVLAQQIRNLGFSARSHTNADSDLLHLPLILFAGLGELSRIGELVLNPFLGPRFKSVVVSTDMPLAADRPIDFGLQDFCARCHKCARECPCYAIPFGGKVIFNGYETWKPDVGICARYRINNPKGSACGRCMKMCPFNRDELLSQRLFLWAAIKLPFARRWLARLDDLVGNGERNPIKRWWYDLEVVDGVCVVPRSGTNERDLDPERPLLPGNRNIAIYPAELMPPAASREPFPLDRQQGLRCARVAETPDEAG